MASETSPADATSPDHDAPGEDPPGPDAPGRGVPGQDAPGQDVLGQDALSRGAASESTTGGARKHRSWWREFPVLIVVALVIALIIKAFVVQAFYIPSGSMENTLKVGDKVLVSKLTYHFRSIQPGDIIVFDGSGSWDPVAISRPSGDPLVRLYDATLRPLVRSVSGLFGTAPGQTDYIKRVIGVPGDHVMCCNARGQVTVNGVPLREHSYLFPGNRPADAPLGESGHFNLTVPPGRLWVLGDHRADSDDSRGHVVDPGDGTIPESEVIGRAFVIIWPPSRWRSLPIPGTFLQSGVARQAAAMALLSERQSGLRRSGARRSGSRPSGSRPSDLSRSAAGALAPAGRLSPAPPYVPLAAGLAGALPVTFLRRRRRRRSRR